MTKNHIPFANALALSFSLLAPIPGQAAVLNPDAGKWRVLFEECARGKFTAIEKEADKIMARDPTEGESLIRAYGQRAELSEEYIASGIAEYKGLNDVQKKIVIQKMLAAAMDPSPVFACQQEADTSMKNTTGTTPASKTLVSSVK
jgi:hypothetical protein